MLSADNTLILDCYLDEPACLGVPPFLSPWPRYIYGMLLEYARKPETVNYLTVDQLRTNEYKITEQYQQVILLGGAAVPGKYLGTAIADIHEITKIVTLNPEQSFLIGGSAAALKIKRQKNILAVSEKIIKLVYHLLSGKDREPDFTITDQWAIYGAGLVKKHFLYPDIICEIESGRGCPRQSHCSFCLEGLKQNVSFRTTKGITREVKELAENSISRFRIGAQPDILSYGSTLSNYREGFPEPSVTRIKNLFSALNKLKQFYNFKILNIDNGNPGTILHFPGLSTQILEIISDTVTPGDTLSLGFESFDPAVIKANNLKTDPQGALRVLRLINEIGGKRVQGIPKMLPGINLIQGLAAESMKTFALNYDFLKKVTGQDLLLKRINMRRLNPWPGTVMANRKPERSGKLFNRFRYYRDKIRKEIDHPMLRRIYPAGTVMRELKALSVQQGHTLAKALQSYAITVRLPMTLPLNCFFNAVITGQRERSLTALPLPLKPDLLDSRALAFLPGISKKTAGEIVLNKPLGNLSKLNNFAPQSAELKKTIAAADQYQKINHPEII